uniref:Uncharacterized protein n=1 Tax=Arundo donax TaxID=35708 RepID=A0A0A9HHH3_ARUDO
MFLRKPFFSPMFTDSSVRLAPQGNFPTSSQEAAVASGVILQC